MEKKIDFVCNGCEAQPPFLCWLLKQCYLATVDLVNTPEYCPYNLNTVVWKSTKIKEKMIKVGEKEYSESSLIAIIKRDNENL